MYNILIVDDNLVDLNKNELYITQQFQKNSIDVQLYTFSDSSSIDFSILYDACFLDIDMPHLNGFDIAKQVVSTFPHIIFITNRSDLVYQTFDYQPFGYIRKSHYDNDFRSTLDRLILRLKQYILVDSQRINLKDILYAESFGHYLVIHTQKKDYEIRYKLKNLEKLINNYDFYIINQSYLVNFNHVKEVNNSDCILNNKIRLPISRRKFKDVKRQYEQYIFRSI